MAEKTLPQNTILSIDGMTCGKCAEHVKEELLALPGVDEITVDLDPAGVSTVAVIATQELTDEQFREAVDEAGYELVGVERPTEDQQ